MAPPRRSKRLAASREGSRAPSPVAPAAAAHSPVAPSISNTALRLRALSSPSPPKSPPAPAAISPVTAAATTTTTPAATPRPGLLQRAFGYLFTPTIFTPSPSKKRPAPEDEPENEAIPEPEPPKPAVTVVAATPTRPVHTPRGPSTWNRNQRSSLNAISERTENSSIASAATIRAAEPTPSRNRTISSVRSKREQAARNTPSRLRAWIQPPAPREPNADLRLAKLNHYNEIKEQMKSLEKDEEIREMTAGHRTKRVKIDDLVFIPHNRPGDPSGTFRVYDDDSDDEMEVDEDVELRKNVFEEVIEAPSPPKKTQEQPKQVEKPAVVETVPSPPKQQVQPKEQPKQMEIADERDQPQMVETAVENVQPPAPAQINGLAFPSVGKRTEPYQEGTAQEARLGTIFKMAFDHWTRSGEIMPVF